MYKLQQRLVTLVTIVILSLVIGGRWQVTGAQDTGIANQPPVIEAIAAQAVDVGQTVMVGLTYSDPDSNPVSIGAISDSSAATVTVAGNQLAVAGVVAGNANITITADDGRGGGSSTSFAVTVNEPPPPPTPTNNPPIINSLASQTVEIGQAIVVTLSYSDPDGDAVTLSASSDNAGAAAVAQTSATELTVTGVAAGTANITVTVDDGRSGIANAQFAVTVNALPVPPPTNNLPVIAPMNPQILEVGQSVVVPIGYSDPDGDAVTITPVSDNSIVATVIQSSTLELTVTGVSAGTANVTVTVADGRGGSASAQFAVTVNAPVPPTSTPAPTPSGPPTITSDKLDYAPGEWVTLTGTNWQGDTQVRIITNDDFGSSWRRDVLVTAASDGTIIDTFWLPNWFVANYSVVAVGQQTSRVVITSFTDSSIQSYHQCANDLGTGYTTGDTGCRWINGNLQSNNSRYFEGDATVQRLWITDMVPGSTHTITFKYGTTKGGKHAYDFLTTWNWSENWITVADRCQGITGCTTAGDTTLTIPVDSNAAGFDSAVGIRQFVMRGGTMTSATTPTIVSGSYAGDSETAITVTFTVGPGSGAMCETKQSVTTCGVALWFGAHVATQANWGVGNGAGGISGSPYHVALDAMDGAAIGQRDNQMQAGVVTATPNGTIVIVKDAIPNDAQDFSFNLNNNGTINQNFLLDDDSDPTLPNSQSFSVPPGTWTAAELGIPSGWTLTNLVCVDPTNNTTVNLGTATASINLASNETVTCTFTDTKEPDKLNLNVTKTATPSFTRTYTWGLLKEVDETQINIAEGGTATFNYTVTVTHNFGIDSGWAVNGTITVSNPNSFGVSGVSVTDSIDPNATCVVSGGSSDINANSSATFNYTCTYSAAPAATIQTNTATASWTPFGSPTNSASGTGSVDWGTTTPSLVDESVTVSDSLDPNSPRTFTYTDPSPTSFSYSRTVSGVAGTCTEYDNTATSITNDSGTTLSSSVTVTVCVGSDLTVVKTADASKDRLYKWLIDKSVDDTRIDIADGGTATFNYDVTVTPNGFTDSGFTLGGSIIISNPNDWQDITVDVADTLDAGGTCTITEVAPYVVPKSGTLTLHYTCTTDGTTTKNTASVTWDKATYFTPTGSASDDAPVSFALDVETDKVITVVDDKTDPLNPVTLGTWDWADGPHTFEYALDKSGVAGTCTDYTNTAVIDETDQSDSQTVTVCVGLDLTVVKTADASKDRLYKWLIDKSVDDTRIDIADGGTATFNYDVTVTPNGFTDSGFTLGGSITISNPNDWQDITVDVADTLDAGGTCTITEVAPYVVPKSGTLTLHYTCTTDGTTTKNTASVTWDKATYFTPTGSASDDAPVSFALDVETDKVITVVDDKTDPLNPVTLGTWDWADGPHTFEYALDKSGVAGTCTDYTNTAVIDETDQSDSQTVTVCVGLDLTVVKTADASKDRLYKWLIDKSVDDTRIDIADGGTATFNYTVDVTPNGFTDSGFTLGGSITISNPNDWQDITVDVADTLDAGGTCTITEVAPYVVPKSGTLTLHYTCTTDGTTTQNTATVTWDAATYFTPTGSASDDAPVSFALDIETNKVITVVDDKTDPLNPVTLGTANYFTGPFTFTYSLDKSGVAGTCTDYTNTAVIDETDQSDSQTVTVCVGSDLTVVKTADASKDRLYKWLIDKSVDDTRIDIADGGTATFNYTVDVTPNGFLDSGFTLGGSIIISNPNDWQDITVDVADTLDAGGTCTITEVAPYVVPKSGTLTLHYTCTTDGTTTKNTASVTWDKATYFTPTGSASDDAPVSFALDVETDKVITVVDDKTDPLNPVTLGTWDWADGPHTFEYALDKSGVAGTCTDYTNTAVIDETDQSDSQTVTVCVGLDLTVVKTADASKDRLYKWLIDKSVDDTRIDIADGGTATFNYTVDVTPNGFTDSGFTLGGSITISNPNDWQDITVDVADTLDAGGTCTITEVAPYVVPKSGTLTLHYTCTTDGTTTQNTATVTWDAATYFTPTGSASDDAPVSFALDIETNKVITVVDDKTDPLNPVTLGTANYFTGPFTFTYSLDKSGVAGTCTDYTNTAVIDETDQSDSQTVTVCVGLDLTVVKTADASKDRLYKWLIDKSVDDTRIDIADGGTATFNYTVDVTPNGFLDSGFTLGGSITISNPNDWQDITVDVADTLDAGGTCTITEVAPYVVPKSGTLTLHYTCTTDGTTTKNTASVTWDKATYFTPTGSASDDAPVSFALDVETDKVITVVDDKTDPLNPVTLGTANYFTGPFTFTYSLDKSGVAGTCTDYTNTAVIDETDQSDSQTVTVCVGSDLTVEKSAIPTFTRAFAWDISKSVDKTVVKQNGGSATFNYTVVVNQTGFTDSAWKVVGTITISNPNDWEAITANVTDAVNNGGVCTVTGGTSVVVPAATSAGPGSVTLNYTCTYASKPTPYSATNTATVTWNQSVAHTPSSSATATKNFAFDTGALGNPTNVNQPVTVTDTFNGVTTTLGTVTGVTTPPYTSKTFTYARTVPVPSYGCQSYPNIARIVETGQIASQTVKVCGPVKTGALTKGYWQNKNGQGIITGGAPTVGVCNSGTWLRQFNPFKDLSATASCTQVATYVFNIIKAANASGAAMNAMLKAQMLATALDVYFSDPALGGNKINAPAPIGGVVIDLTKICKNIGTCSIYENVSSAFGGASSLTVVKMLTYAASQSNSGGSVWYGQVKATQELAKDAFDAINNEVAFSL